MLSPYAYLEMYRVEMAEREKLLEFYRKTEASYGLYRRPHTHDPLRLPQFFKWLTKKRQAFRTIPEGR